MAQNLPKSRPLLCELGFETVSILPSVFHHITKYNFRDEGNTLGILFGNKKGTAIVIEQSFHLDPNLDVDNIIIDENFYTVTKMEFLGFFSNGNFPNDVDIKIFQAIFKSYKPSLFLLKFNGSHNFKNLSATIYECAHLYQRLHFLQLHNYPECEDVINSKWSDKKISETATKVFYIMFRTRLPIERCWREPDLSEEQKLKIQEKRKNKPLAVNFREYSATIRQISERIRPKVSKATKNASRNEKIDYLQFVKEFNEESPLEVTYNFSINYYPLPRVACWTMILNCQFYQSHFLSELQAMEKCQMDAARLTFERFIDPPSYFPSDRFLLIFLDAFFSDTFNFLDSSYRKFLRCWKKFIKL